MSLLSSSMMVWLRSFEAAARHANFTRAAAELCVSQGAISQQVKNLEGALRRPLFVRASRSLSLTPEGERLYAVAHDSFRSLDLTLSQLRASQNREEVTLSCSPSFAMVWLTPRLGNFFRTCPGTHLKIQGEFHRLDLLQLHRQGLNAAVRYDLGRYEDLEAKPFLDEWLLPVASPKFLEQHPELKTPAQLKPQWLLHDSSPWVGAGEYEEWEFWLEQAEVGIGELELGNTFNLSLLALAAAANGQGVAMGRAALVLDDLVSGRLIDIFKLSVPSVASYAFITPPDADDSVQKVEMWLQHEAREFRDSCRYHLPHLK
ncbi:MULTISPECIES: LysR family transcriptional regulator [unclassified Variovorax]|uniref:LysR family transcriptional regulator n=1 Tax=unclassified Variovorax TaxID=663243 RepID=UPI0025787AC7|nr:MULTISPECIES: LysR family transcriptional regulator [unclassified Variovorax]MDM0088234.1 LysR family transcriptional regulator [Variovorax sp. J22G40]MDM0146307.1 LysR family transcriptional regulator [Variovorax sp. J2P1-31]